jgi:hypothetical protein
MNILKINPKKSILHRFTRLLFHSVLRPAKAQNHHHDWRSWSARLHFWFIQANDEKKKNCCCKHVQVHRSINFANPYSIISPWTLYTEVQKKSTLTSIYFISCEYWVVRLYIYFIFKIVSLNFKLKHILRIS